MQSLFDLIQKEKTPTKGTERGELLQFITDKINLERKGTKYKQVKIVFIATKLKGFSLWDIYYLKSVCTDSERRGGNFSRTFFGSLKVQNPDAF